MRSSLPASPPLTPPSPFSVHLHSARTALYRTLSPPSPPPSDYGYVEPVPNLELHSAAAEGNVGLVHYALTHGQPVNSVLHGVQPIHAAAAGGSVAAVKMLIDRGADVNAPRLPRRYSNEKKKGAPSLGAAGATPLHFAAANGHADIVQILLTCGAVSNKSDKLGQTAASLAEANSHDDVLHVLRVYDHLTRQDSLAGDSASIASGSMRAGPFSEDGSPARSTLELDEEGSRPSSKGKEKERAMSIISTRSDASGIIKLRKSLDGLLGRRSRKNSLSMEPMEDVPPVPPLPASPPHIDIQHPPHSDVYEDERGMLQPPPLHHDPSSRPISPDGLPYPPSLAPSSVYHSPMGGNSPAASHVDLPAINTDIPAATNPVTPAGTGTDLARITSGGSAISAASGQSSTFASIRSGFHPIHPREHRTSHSSRRPSLPSILEKAAHPGQAFRNALHRKDHNDQVRFSSEASQEGDSPRSVSGNSFFSRGRNRTPENAISSGSSAGSPNLSGAQDKARKYMSRHAFIGLFRRTNSPPSRSPSPPRRPEGRPIDAQELEEGIERFKRASIEMDRQERRSLDEPRENPVILRQVPNSAPAYKTRFFEDLSPTPPVIPNSAFVTPRSEGRTSPISPTGERPWNRPRKGSNVIAPSPLANEWARESSDSDSTVPSGVRRTKTEGARDGVGPSRLSLSTGPAPGSLRGNKQRSATLPSSVSARSAVLDAGPGTARIASSSRLIDLALDDRADLRSGVLRRESERKRGGADGEEAEDAEDEEEEEEVFHDALDVEGSAIDLPEPAAKAMDEVKDEKEAAEEGQKAGVDLSPPATLAIRNRFRGASIGSVNSQSSRLSSPSSIMKYGSNPSEDSGSDRHARLRVVSDQERMPPPPPPSSMYDSRPRGKSVSSIATTASGSGLAFSSYNQSTSATSLTPPSTLSITLGSAFPPVPEDDVTDGSSPSLPPVPQRKFSSRAEAAKAIKKQEDDMLQLAQLPLNADSSRDLAAQLAAYGESHVMEQELAQMERRERKHARRQKTGNGKSKFIIPDDTSSEAGSASGVSGSFVSAQSAPSAVGSGMSSEVRSGSIVSSNVRDAPSMLSVEAPITSVPNISSIYDRRANLYREKMQTLTSAQSLHPPSSRTGDRRTRQRAVTDNHPPGPPAWLTGSNAQAGSSRAGRQGEISASLPAGSLSVLPPGQGIMAGGPTPKPGPRTRKESFNSIRVPPAPAPPIADIVNTRYQGLPSVSSYPRSSTAFYSSASRAGTTRQYSSLSPAPSSSSQIQPAPAPAVSIFSHRYAGPHDGGESDDSEGEQKGYTMIENDWRGGKILAPGDLGAEGLARKGKWGFKGPFGKKK